MGKIGKLDAEEVLLAGTRLVDDVIDGNRKALLNPDFRRELDKGFDLIMVYSMVPRDVGYFMVHKTNAAFVILTDGGQGPLAHTSWAVGQPHNLAYMPFAGMNARHPLDLPTKILSLVITIGAYLLR